MSPRSFDDRYFGPPSKPRPVEGGLKARSNRGAIGESWWSRRFLDVLESFALGTRLTRGRSYARRGQVISLDVTAGAATAAVQGSRVKPYRVRIGLEPFPELVWARAEIALAEQALPSAKLLAGEVPPELEEIFAAAGAPLFPHTVRELDQRCSCPDQEVPCKHLAATFYLLAEAFDADPFLVLRWRGRDRDQLLTRLRALRSADTVEVPGGDQRPPPVAGAALALGGLNPPSEDLSRFWVEPVPLPDRPPTLHIDPGLLLRQLPTPGAALGGERLAERLRPAYERFASDPERPRGSK